MYITYHLSQKMSKRGITKNMVDFALHYGKIQGDKYVVDKNFLKQHLKNLKSKSTCLQSLNKKFKRFAVARLISYKLSQVETEYRVTAKLLDKGGIVVICKNNTLITSYDVNSYCKY